VSDLLNPYASPQLPTEADPAYEGRTIRGSFVVDDALQREAARGYQMRHVLWLVLSLLPMLALLPVPLLLWRGDPQLLAMGTVALFTIGSCATIGLHVALDWSIFWHNLRQLRRHPVLGAAGTWQFQIDEESISIATERGQQTWPLEEVRRIELTHRPIVLWLERDLAIALPRHGDYGEDDYASVRKSLRQRITHIGAPLTKGR
jgi:hypothetical protein